MRAKSLGLYHVSKIRGCFLVRMGARHCGVKEGMSSQRNENKDRFSNYKYAMIFY